MESDGGNGLHALIAAEGSAVLVLGGAWVLAARFSREGDDLLLIGPEGQHVLVRDYFTTDAPPRPAHRYRGEPAGRPGRETGRSPPPWRRGRLSRAWPRRA